jgi:hypothetical protein
VRCALFTALLLLAAGCTLPQYECGHWVPCARGSVQSCTRTDHSRCHYLLSDGTLVQCASCDDCSAAEVNVISWCAAEPISISTGDSDLAHAPTDLAAPPGSDLACYPAGFVCNGDPWCCPKCCAGHCDGNGGCPWQ